MRRPRNYLRAPAQRCNRGRRHGVVKRWRPVRHSSGLRDAGMIAQHGGALSRSSGDDLGVNSVGLDGTIPGDSSVETIAGIIADEWLLASRTKTRRSALSQLSVTTGDVLEIWWIRARHCRSASLRVRCLPTEAVASPAHSIHSRTSKRASTSGLFSTGFMRLRLQCSPCAITRRARARDPRASCGRVSYAHAHRGRAW